MSSMMLSHARIYFSLTKPRIWWLLVFVGFGGLMAASNGRPDPYLAVTATLSLTMGSAGAETVANYLDRDIDAVMRRTMRRALPRGLIRPPWKALALGLVLTFGSFILASSINLLTLLFIMLGVADYVVVYVMYAKRRTPLNIILGSFAGGAPVMAGYVAAANQLTPEAWIMAGLVVLWIPSHVWSLALRYKDDYVRASIPMLPVVIREDKAIRCIASTAILMVVFSVALYFFYPSKYGAIYVAAASITGLLLGYLSLKLIVSPTPENSWRLFKFTSPHLALIFAAIILDAAL